METADDSFTQKVLFWQDGKTPEGENVDADSEDKRLSSQKTAGPAPKAPKDTATIQQQQDDGLRQVRRQRHVELAAVLTQPDHEREIFFMRSVRRRDRCSRRAPLSSFRPGAAGPQAFQFALQNGMQVVVIPDRRAPVVTHMLWFKVGGVDDPPGQSGLAPFLRAHDVPRHEEESGRPVHRDRRAQRRRDQRLHHPRLHRLLRGDRQGPPLDGDGARGRPHGESRPLRSERRHRAQRRARGAAHARRQRSAVALRRAARRRRCISRILTAAR